MGATAGPERGPHLLFEGRLWLRGCTRVAGVDEAGRGPLAGPVVAAAVIFPAHVQLAALPPVDDSKRLSPQAREALVPHIHATALAWAVAAADVGEIDRLNIAQATFLAMSRAVAALEPPAEHALVDGLRNGQLRLEQTAIVGGDGLSASIAAASILAKVERDNLMRAYDACFPGYGFAEHKGYPTPAHRAALRALGPCSLHRRSFRLF